jgi:RNA methyltransferase, TrmH family
MLSKAQIKHIISLQSPKFRKLQQQFIAEGPKLVSEFLNSPFKVDSIYALEEWQGEARRLAGRKGIMVTDITGIELEKISALVTPNQVLAVVNIPPLTLDWAGLQKDLTLMLDDIRDPGNLGTIIRIADWFGISQVICSPDCVDVWNPKVVQASMGSVARVKVFYQDLKVFLEDLKEDEIPVYGTFLEGENICISKLDRKGIIIIGSESHGITPQLLPYIHERLYIPSFRSSLSPAVGAESLNASVATGIILYEFRRRILMNTEQ